jgi:segregation and condensation protein A
MSTPKASARKRAAPPAPVPAPEPAEGVHAPAFEGQYRLEIPKAGFEGPLDLLLHLIQQHELDILDIPVSFVTEKFLQYIYLMRTLSIDVASEYLVMAATLAHIKSKMLLPVVPAGQDDDGLPGDEEEDPRAELVRRLLEYQKYKAAAAEMGERGTLGKDVFSRGAPEPVPEGPAPFAKTGVFSLLDAFEKILKKNNVKLDHEVVFDRISITDRIVELTERLTFRKAMTFEDLLIDPKEARALTRFDVVITFLAILEMARLRLIRVYQTDAMAMIHVELSVQDGDTSRQEADEKPLFAEMPGRADEEARRESDEEAFSPSDEEAPSASEEEPA